MVFNLNKKARHKNTGLEFVMKNILLFFYQFQSLNKDIIFNDLNKVDSAFQFTSELQSISHVSEC